MFSNLMIGFFAGAGLGGWVYAKTYRSTGGNTTNALIAGALCGLVVMILLSTILGMIFKT